MIYRFGHYELDVATFELRADGKALDLEPQVFALLALLVENRERLVSKDEIIEKVWDGRAINIRRQPGGHGGTCGHPREDFVRAFPMQPAAMRARVLQAPRNPGSNELSSVERG